MCLSIECINTCPALVVVALRPASSLRPSHTGASHLHGPLLCPLVIPESIICRVIASLFFVFTAVTPVCRPSRHAHFVLGPARVIFLQPVSSSCPPSSCFHPSCHGVVEVGPSLMHAVRPLTSDVASGPTVLGPDGSRTAIPCQASISPHRVPSPPRSLSSQILRTPKFLHNPNPIAIFAVFSSSSSASRDPQGNRR